jgi:archaellum biogenesis ATPase FlaH
VDEQLLSGEVQRGLSSDKHRTLFDTTICDLASLDISARNVTKDFLAVKLEAARGRLATTLLAGTDDEQALHEYVKWTNGASLNDGELSSEILHGLSLTTLVDTVQPSGLISLAPDHLTSVLDGGVLRGHHVIVFARPEIGKTLFLINLVAVFLKQDLRVLYVGNEEPIKDIALRLVGRLTGATKWDIFDDPQLADSIARENGYDNLIMAQLAPGTIGRIGKLMDKYEPDVVIIDQLRNLFTKEESRVNELDKLARGVRDLGIEHNALMVSVTQAGDTASGKAILTMSDIDSSKTGIPASGDVIIGIGATSEDEKRNRRMLTLCKNKRSGNHDSFPVMIDPTLCTIRSII